jgi:hypothetical protein
MLWWWWWWWQHHCRGGGGGIVVPGPIRMGVLQMPLWRHSGAVVVVMVVCQCHHGIVGAVVVVVASMCQAQGD